MKKIISKYKKRFALIALLTGMLIGGMMPMQSAYAQPTVVRVYFHICRDDNGTDAGATEAQIQSEFNQLKTDFAPGNICFMYMGLDYISNTFINQGGNGYWWNDSLISHFIPNCINIFYYADSLRTYKVGHNNTSDNSNENGATADICTISRDYIGVAQTISFAVAKCFALGKTWDFISTNCCWKENINGSNSSWAADRVTDTPADPWAHILTPCFSTSSCCYTGTCQDGNGQSNYNPPYTNLMADWWTLGWGPLTLTPGQFTKAHSGLSLHIWGVDLLPCQPPPNSQLSPATYSSGTNWFSASNTITTNGVVHFYANNKSTLVSSLVTLSPGFRSNPSAGGLTLIKGYSCAPGVPRVASEIKPEIISANEVSLKCYPNPFSGNLTVEFDLSKDDDASIKLYNMVGKEMKTISKTFFAKGKHEVTIDASDLSAGIYFIVLQSSAFKKEQKMIKVN